MNRSRALLFLLALPLAGCIDTTEPDPVPPAEGIIVLHAFGALPGIVETDSAVAGRRIPLPAEFDGGRMRLQRDTVLTTSSGFMGDNRLYVADLRSGALESVELPANANAGGATLSLGFRAGGAVVAFRGLGTVGLVRLPEKVVTQLTDVGRCPYDVAVHNSALWIVDHNAACESDYSLQGDSRLFRVIESGFTRDTVPLPGVRHATSILVSGNRGIVSSIGVTTYASDGTPTFVSPGAITIVDLNTGEVLGSRSLPQGTSGASTRMGLNGLLYVTAYANTTYETTLFIMDPVTLDFVGTRTGGEQHQRLTTSSGQPARCQAVTADRLGRMYCATNQGPSSATSMVVFANNGVELRRFGTGGTGAVDISMR